MANKILTINSFDYMIPTEPGVVAWIGDHGHLGTEIYRTFSDGEREYRCVSLDWSKVHTGTRCVLVELIDAEVDDLPGEFGLDLDHPNGVALVVCEPDDDVPGRIVWDSDEQ